jgi:hypothetical protein
MKRMSQKNMMSKPKQSSRALFTRRDTVKLIEYSYVCGSCQNKVAVPSSFPLLTTIKLNEKPIYHSVEYKKWQVNRFLKNRSNAQSECYFLS